MSLLLPATSDRAEAQLDAGISASSSTILLTSGGDLFPQPRTGAATATGSATSLPATGVGSAGIAVGDFIENLTDGSWAVVTAVSADELATSPLRGGSANLWTAGDAFAVDRFVLTVEKRDAAGLVTQFEKILIGARSGNQLTVAERGFEGTTPDAFAADDWAALHLNARVIEGLRDALGEAHADLADRYTKSEIAALLAARNWKTAVRAATTAAGDLATAFAAGQSIDGVTLAAGDRILLKNQTAPAENGIYTVAASGAPARAADFDAGSEVASAVVPVAEGTNNADAIFFCQADAGAAVGTDALPFTQIGAGVTPANQAEAEAGTDNTKMMTPLRTAEAITAQFQTNMMTKNWAIVPGDVTMTASDTARSAGGETWIKVKEIQAKYSGTYRVSFDMLRTNDTTGEGAVYKNGALFGTVRSTGSSTYVTFTEDLTFAAGDLIQVYARKPTGFGGTSICNFRLKGGAIYLDVDHAIIQD